MAYYSDPNFLQRMQAMRTQGQTFGGPFAATRNAVAQRMQGKANTALTNQLAQQGSDFRYNQAGFQNAQNWAGWGNRVQRAATDLSAREAINYQRKMAYEQAKQARKKSRMGLLSSGIGMLGTIGGAALGSMIAPGVGTAAGASIGGQLGGSF